MKLSAELLANAFIKEYEIVSSPKLLFPFLATPQGLALWFADRARSIRDGFYSLEWDRADHLAVEVSNKINKSVRYAFVDEEGEAPTAIERQGQLPMIEFAIQPGNFSQTVFLRVTDTTPGLGDVEETWDTLVSHLKERISG